jgi:transposase
MKVSQWAEIRRLAEIEGLSHRAIARRLRCSFRTVKKALQRTQPPDETRRPLRGSQLDPYKPKIDSLVAQYPELSAVRVREEIARGPDGYRGGLTLVRDYLRKTRPRPSRRVYQEVRYEPGQALQIDWGSCGRVRIGQTWRKVSVFVAVLCHSRLTYIEFCLSQRKAEFYRSLVHALEFFGGSPRQVIFDNLKAAVLNGHGRSACLHPEFLALCGHFYLQPIACQRRDPESKGGVEAKVRYVKHNCLAGRDQELTCWDDYGRLAVWWRDEVANVRLHATTKQRPIDRYPCERERLRPLPNLPYDTDEVAAVLVSSHARVHFDGNRYSVPPQFVGQTLLLRADEHELCVLQDGTEVARHVRCYERGQLLVQTDHQLAALAERSRLRARDLEMAFDAFGPVAREFHLELRRRPVKTQVHLRKILQLVQLYGRDEVLAALAQAAEYRTFDAAYVETLVLQERRRRELPSPVPLRPKRPELLEETVFDEPDPAIYDRLCDENNRVPRTSTPANDHVGHPSPETATDATSSLPASGDQGTHHD